MAHQLIADPILTKQVVRRFIDEVINRGNGSLLTELVAADHVSHCAGGELYGREGVRLEVEELRAAFTDLRVELTELLAEGDRVAHRFVLSGTHVGPFLGVPASGHQVTMPGMGFNRLANGQVAESWTTFDLTCLCSISTLTR